MTISLIGVLEFAMVSNVRLIEFQEEQHEIAGDIKYQRLRKGHTPAGPIFDPKSINALAASLLLIV